MSPVSIVFQAHVSGVQDERFRPRRQLHVHATARLRASGRAPLEVRERRVGGGRQGGTRRPQLRVRAPRLPQLRLPLDEGAYLLLQGETHQQDERRRTGETIYSFCSYIY